MLTRIAVLVIAVLPFCFAARETRVARCVTAPPSAGYEPRLKQIGSRLCVQGGTGYVLLENYTVGLTGRDMDAPDGWRIVVVAVRSDSLAVVGEMSVHRIDENPFGLVCTPDAVYLNANGSLMALSPGLTTKQELNLPQNGVPYALVGAASDQYVMTEASYDRQDVVTLFRKRTLQIVYRATFDARPLPPYPLTDIEIGFSRLGAATIASPTLLLAQLERHVAALEVGPEAKLKLLPLVTDKPPLVCGNWIVGVGSGDLQMMTSDYKKAHNWTNAEGYRLIDATCVHGRYLVAYGVKVHLGLLHNTISDSRLFKLDLETMQESASPEKIGHVPTPPLRPQRRAWMVQPTGVFLDRDMGAVAYDPDHGNYLVTDGTRVCSVDAF